MVLAGPTSGQKKIKKQDEAMTCFFCKKGGHMKKECPKYAVWRQKKGMLLTLVCSEVNLASVPIDSWWVDSGATTHICMSMRGRFGADRQMMLKDSSTWATGTRLQ
ncbi:hypothetical protein Dimus_038845 [Dionaea muscipula]